MLTQEDDVEIHALAARGRTKAAIARHAGWDRKTVSKYLARPRGEQRERAPSCLEPFRAYVEARFDDDPHVDATVLFRELVDAGFDRSYPTLVRELRRLELRPVSGGVLRADDLRSSRRGDQHDPGPQPAPGGKVGGLPRRGRSSRSATRCSQTAFGIAKPPAPAPQLGGDLIIAQPLGGHQHHLGTNHLPIRQRITTRDVLKHRVFLVGQLDPIGAMSRHQRPVTRRPDARDATGQAGY